MLKHHTLTYSHTLGLDNFQWSLCYVRCTFTDHEYLIINLDIPNGFGQVQWDKLQPGWPFEIALDWTAFIKTLAILTLTAILVACLQRTQLNDIQLPIITPTSRCGAVHPNMAVTALNAPLNYTRKGVKGHNLHLHMLKQSMFHI